jgi:hypothetical protein
MRSLAPLLKSIEIPGLKIELRELEKVGQDAEAVGLIAQPRTAEEAQPTYISVAKSDPNLALAGLRIEIERRLIAMAKATGKHVERESAGQLMRFLHNEKLLSDPEYSTLQELLVLLNRAVHGAYVDSNTAQWAIDVGPKIIAALDERLDKMRTD